MTPEDKSNETKSEYTAYVAMLNDAHAIQNCSQSFYNQVYSEYLSRHQQLVEDKLISDSDLIPRVR